MSLELHAKQIIDRWVGAARPNREGRPTWQVGLDYMATRAYYHATTYYGFTGTAEEWLSYLIDRVPADVQLQQGLTQHLTNTTTAHMANPTVAKAEANSVKSDASLDSWLDEL